MSATKDNHRETDRLPNGESREKSEYSSSHGEGGNYWQLRYEKLLVDYNHLQTINQNLEEKLLNVVENFEKKKEELVAGIEHERSILVADVNKLSTKLVDARIKINDYEERELVRQTECNSSCHNNKNHPVDNSKLISLKEHQTINEQYDPNVI